MASKIEGANILILGENDLVKEGMLPDMVKDITLNDISRNLHEDIEKCDIAVYSSAKGATKILKNKYFGRGIIVHNKNE